MKYCLKPFAAVLMLFVYIASPAVTQAADRLIFLKGSTIMQSSIDAMIALPGGGIVSGADIYMGFTKIPFAEEDVLVHNLDNNSFSVYRDSAYFRSGILENATPFELFVHMPTTQFPVSLFEYESSYGETTLDNLLSLSGAVVFYDLVPYAVPGTGPGGGDTTPPILLLPGNITVDATSDQGSVVTFAVSATDNVDSNPVISCTPASGSLFPIGETTVSCSATDDSNNTTRGSFTVTVNPLPSDFDHDGIPDHEDNCIEAANPDQLDTDSDGYGNMCDGDLNNDGSTNTLDLNLYKLAHRSAVGYANYNIDADFNGDGVINTLDLNIYKGLHRLLPGPSCCVP